MSSGLPRVLILGDETKGKVRRVIDQLLPWLDERAEVVGLVFDRERSLENNGADYCFVFGGDGTILSAARRMGSHQVPTLGVNLGRLGFLAEVAYASGEGVAVLKQAIESAFAGRLPENRRLMVECRKENSEHEPVLVLNDAVVQRSRAHGLIGVTAKVGGDYVTTYFGDGLIMSTATGSTAYSLAAGGPILSPELDALVLTPLAPHALPVRPLVVQAARGMEMRIEGKAGAEIGTVSLDGQVHWPVVASDVLRFDVSPVRFRLLSLQGSSFFKILRRKFGWGGSPRYEA